MWRRPPAGVFPIVVKRASGSGGKQVRVAEDGPTLDAAIRDVDPDGRGGVFFQELVAGHQETFGGIAERGRLLAGATYRTYSAPSDPLGPAECLQVTDSKDVWDQSELLCRERGYTGFVCIDFIAPPAGRAALIDVNPRVFGSWLALQQSGVDLLGAYLSLFGLSPAPSALPRAPVGHVRMIRHAPRGQAPTWRAWASEARSSARSVGEASHVVGWPYLVVGGARSTARLTLSAARLAGRGRRQR